ncbi:transglutaminase domain-containing protein [Pseudoflavitalea sp. X16]|uniref:transglutaminase domain-containing protein n=1 Tax=Paraflavitalea devenefica TaxID=2716334 RepID=UPI001423B518|nr:transglutaminase domain-containing protein [Paraflavitalea devenefica]NII29260.1 transglutaminase domain-containing protein [Paraflavitalea devenefica]
MLKRLCYYLILLFPVASLCQQRYPDSVEAVLRQSNGHRAELEKAIDHFKRSGDSLQLKAIYFLVSNMDAHYSASYYWVDSLGRKVAYNELDYPDFAASIQAFEALKRQHKKLSPRPVVYRDIDTIQAAFLIDNVERAFASWRANSIGHISFTDFCEYVLPYRMSFEPLQNWRGLYSSRFKNLYPAQPNGITDTLCLDIGNDIKKWFTNVYGIEQKKEPLPRLGAMQLLHRKKGACEDIADLTGLILRANGYAASIDYIPAWSTASGLHFLNYTYPTIAVKNHFDAAEASFVDTLSREPAKVIRTTYSRQKNVAASFADTSQIPEGFMRLKNYKDVTPEYWVTQDIAARLFALKGMRTSLAFAAVWNYFQWRPVWWGRINNNSTVFSNMSRGAIYLPMYYVKGQLVPAGWPIAAGYDNTLVLQPDTLHTRTIRIKEQNPYLLFRTGKKYTLYWWGGKWRKAGTRVASADTKEFEFPAIPMNALLLLVPEYSQKKERPFIVTATGERRWF